MADVITAEVPITKNLVEWERENDALIVSITRNLSPNVLIAAIPNETGEIDATVEEIKKACKEGHEQYLIDGD